MEIVRWRIDAWPLLSVLVGGLLAIGGSIAVARYEGRRRHRLEIYLNLLGRLQNCLRNDPFGQVISVIDLAEQIDREALVASRGDHKRARPLIEQVRTVENARRAVAALPMRDRYKPDVTNQGRILLAENAKALALAKNYDQWLARRFRSQAARTASSPPES